MSDTPDFGFNLKKAVRFNESKAVSLGWYGKIPASAIKDFPDLSRDPIKGSQQSKQKFAAAVRAMQLELFFGDEDQADGMLGTGTRREMLLTYSPIDDDARYYLHHGMRLEAPKRENISRVITYKDPGGLDLHRSTTYERKGRPYYNIVLHWSGTTTLKGCYRALMNKRVSSHFGVGLGGVIYQWVDTEFFTAHAGGGNRHSIGIDICTTPKKSHKDSLERKGHKVEIMQNTTGRGDKKCLTCDPTILKATQELVLDLCELHNIPLRSPRAGGVMGTSGEHYYGLLPKSLRYSEEGAGIFGHHHISKKKWDIAPWQKRFLKGLGL